MTEYANRWKNVPYVTERDEMDIYLDRFNDMRPEDILRALGRLKDFILKYMTPEGKRFYEESRNKGLENKL